MELCLRFVCTLRSYPAGFGKALAELVVKHNVSNGLPRPCLSTSNDEVDTLRNDLHVGDLWVDVGPLVP